LSESIDRSDRTLPKDAQIILFSATFPDQVVRYASKFAPKANQITLKHEELTVEGIKQLYMDCTSEQDKYDVLVKLYGLMTIGSSIIFVKVRVHGLFKRTDLTFFFQRRDTASEIERRMVAEGHKVAALHGAFEGQERDRIIDAFRSGHAKVLITTNVLARGIDVQSVSMVVNYVSETFNEYDIPLMQHFLRTFPRMPTETQTHKLTCIELVELVGLVVLVSVSALFMIRGAGDNSLTSRPTLKAI
jgi:ATP-dependent RNA helicase DDX19/DBP5